LSASVIRYASSSSSARWKTRQSGDSFAREAKVQGLKSRAAFKLLQINDKHRIFKKGDTVVDLVCIRNILNFGVLQMIRDTLLAPGHRSRLIALLHEAESLV